MRNFVVFSFAILFVGCSTLPPPHHKKYSFPKNQAFVGGVTRAYVTLGVVRSKVNFPSLDPLQEEAVLCQNYYNKVVRDLVRMAKAKGADAVIDVRSVVFLEDGRRELYVSAECSDDGLEGQVLAQAVAIKWKDPAQNPHSSFFSTKK